MIIKKAFTLIELMISITIVVVLTMATYAPYSYYQNKTKLKVTTREISQLIYEWRNMAMNWSVGETWNSMIWIYFDSKEAEKNSIKLFSYPFDIEKINIDRIEKEDIKFIKSLVLQKGVEIDSIWGKDNLLFTFDAISWKSSYYTWIDNIKKDFEKDVVNINFSFKNSTSENLKRTIKYYTSTNIIDY